MYQGVEAQQTGQAHTIYQDNLTKSANIMKFVDSVMDQPTIPAVNNQIVQSNVGGENIQSTRIIPNSNTETVLSVNNNSLAPAPSQQQPPKTAAVQTPITTRPPATGVAVVLPIARQQHKHQQNTQQQSCPNVSSAPNMPITARPNTFELGQGDKAKLEKQMLRKEFREHGLEAQLPGLDTTDPLNTLDAHYWLAK
uniref:Uncharacterized protein n=1 Tax=Ditylenchus dipsaci TaxID=166011 RepID=A0A915DM59_9BILA